MTLKSLVLSSLALLTNAHMAAYHKAMYCFNGTVAGQVNYNNDDPVSPLWMLQKNDYWFHHFNGCDEFPPAPGDFLELPAGGSFTVEVAANRGVTSLSFNGQFATEWGDGQNHPEDYSITNLAGAPLTDSNCIGSPNMHTQNQSMAAGSAFAISYQSELSEVTIDNLVVFTVRYNTPWKRLTSYDVPKDMPACPADGCTCAWVWIPNGCGEPNIYMQGFKCMVTNPTSTTPLATPKPPVWCEEDQSKCTQGAKQILIWNQAEGNNIVVNGADLSGSPKSPAYNSKCGFQDGAQNDIFATSSGAMPAAIASAPSSVASSSSIITSSSPAISPYSSSTSLPMTSSTARAPSAVSSYPSPSSPSSSPISSSMISSSAAASTDSAPPCETYTSTTHILFQCRNLVIYFIIPITFVTIFIACFIIHDFFQCRILRTLKSIVRDLY
ncbi:uncharacterized protein EDB93DRAFT_699735 [Suillus bovinus]|uniref:uncharacterized protein n=1 Tax=Suillus bovinus TaxID=48563 RepID=UPI001B85EF07|nr:uncharacterized protein EDB93DRAFT_699735 [Suillus bovinus]KAG2139623.1 hypothetical protein EDB93DRAFT_699735 [Suillus bovinus]